MPPEPRPDLLPDSTPGSLSRLRRGLRALRATEAYANVLQATLLGKDLTPTVRVEPEHDDVVVLIHGFLASAGVLRPLREALERRDGVGTASFSHFPGVGVVRIAESLRALVLELPEGARVHLVGHSLGGIAARWYVQELGGARRVTQTISIAAPFRGARLASALPIAVGADLHRNSPLLRKLREGARDCRTPHTSIIGETDMTGFDLHGAALGEGSVHIVAGRGHNAVLYDEGAIDLVSKLIRP